MAGRFDLAIVGAGFAGAVCARSAALRGLRVLLLDRQPRPGSLVRTTGLLVKEVAERWEVPPRLTRRIRGVRLYGPSLRFIDLDSPGYYFLATDTARLMAWLAREAGRAGAYLSFGQSFRGVDRTSEGLELLATEYSARFLVGADGPLSPVARHCGLGRNGQFLAGIEGEFVGLRRLDPDRLHCFIDSELAPGYVGWAFVGLNGVAQIGLACRQPARPRLDAFLRRLAMVFDVDGARLIGRRGGLIPIGGRVDPYAGDRVLLVGDAAGIVSPLTAGGIHTALDSGWRAAHAIADHLLDGAIEPGRAAAAAYPRFPFKRGMRRLLDRGPPNWLIDAVLESVPLRGLARMIYFHRRDFSSARNWAELLGEERRRRA